jgi:polysaccharide export outer membrane protein
MRSSNYRMLLGLVALSLVLPLTVSAQSDTTPQAAAIPGSAHALRVSSGDLLDLGVFDTPELSGKLRVNEAGDITLPVAGAVRVSGMTSEEAAVAVEGKLRSADILKDPHVSIFISEYATQGVTVTGEVKTPGIYPLLGSHGLSDMIAAAGGLNQGASRVVTVTHKSDPEHPEIFTLDNRPGSIAAKVDIQPGDTIGVAKAGVAYVVGEVARPGGFLVESNDRLSVLQVIALAGGATHMAAQDKARLIRKTPTGREELKVPLKAILNGKVVDIPLEDGDILFVPSSKGKIFAYRGVDTAIGLTTGLAVGGRF